MVNHHETGYKDLFHDPELVQQLIEGFAPPSVAALMDFTTLSDHSGKDITPLFNERSVWRKTSANTRRRCVSIRSSPAGSTVSLNQPALRQGRRWKDSTV